MRFNQQVLLASLAILYVAFTTHAQTQAHKRTKTQAQPPPSATTQTQEQGKPAEKKKKYKYYRLNSTDIITVFSGKTAFSVNERTSDEIRTYFAENGRVKQSIHPEDRQRRGKWHAANDQLCLHWDNKPEEFCFDSILWNNYVFYFFKNGKIETIVEEYVEGDDTLFD